MGKTGRLKGIMKLINKIGLTGAARAGISILYRCSYCGGSGRLRGPKGRFTGECPVCDGTGIEILSQKDFIERLYNMYVRGAEELRKEVKKE